MSLQIYNTLTRKKEEFKPLNPPKVGMYVCGVTVYDYCHLGHARALINFDVIYRYLQQKGYQVTFVRNYTDVDDKIIKRAQEKGVPWNQISETFIAAFDEDMKSLGNIKPTIEPKATENMEEIEKIISGLIDKGYAYKAGDDVFFSVRKKADYGKLSGKKIDELESGSRIEIHEDKKDPLDFALWKSSKPGEPQWESPWGPGRPGWHIECSAMGMRYLGETFDIHGGGRDLSFPHHENEIAQSESYSGKPFARYWIHNGFVNINAEKMSKSLGNFMTIRDILKLYHPEVIRLFILSAHYRSSLDYTEQNIRASKQSLERWYTTLDRIQAQCGNGDEKASLTPAEKELQARTQDLSKGYEEAMDDDFNTAKVCGLLFDLAREWNRILDAQEGKVHPSICHSFLEQLSKIFNVFGIFGGKPQEFLKEQGGLSLSKGSLAAEGIEEKIRQRNIARAAKNWGEADSIRKELEAAGVKIKDHPDGTTTWSVV